MSGSGKTFGSKYLKKKIDNSFLIDGDRIRQINDHDLGHSIDDRKKQLFRLQGIAKLVIKQGYFPIVSSVYVDNLTFIKIRKLGIKLIKIKRQKSKINIKLNNKKNVVGKDLKQPNLKTLIIVNNRKFKRNLDKIFLTKN